MNSSLLRTGGGEPDREVRKAPTEAVFLAALILGLVSLDMWPDMLGHCAGLAMANDPLAALGLNARFFWSTGLAFGAFAIAAAPALAKRFDRPLAVVVPLGGIACTVLYSLSSSLPSAATVAALCAALCAIGYAWFEVRLISLVARLPQFSLIVLVLVASRVLKMVCVTVTGLLPESAQIAATVTAPFLTGLAVLVAANVADTAAESPALLRGMAELPFARSSVLSDTTTAYVFLVATAVLSAVARSVSVLGYWGSENVIGPDYVAFVLPVGIALAVAVYFAFFRLRESEMLSHLLVLFLIVLGGLFLQDGALLSTLGLPAVVGAQASMATELFSQFLFWVAMIAAMRMGGVSPYRAVGVAEGCMSAAALALGIALFGRGHLEGVVAAAASYGTLVVVWYLLRRMQKLSEQAVVAQEGAEDPIAAACETVAVERGLTPRESEVLLLLAQGRSRTFIQSELFLSDGTVKTHIRHIYQKLDVHSKQELISFIQGR